MVLLTNEICNNTEFENSDKTRSKLEDSIVYKLSFQLETSLIRSARNLLEVSMDKHYNDNAAYLFHKLFSRNLNFL